jgi:hypothetical protein
MQQQELQIKAQEQQRKAAKDQVDAQLKMKQLDIEQERIQAQSAIAANQAQAQLVMNQEKLKHQGRHKAGEMMHKAAMKEHDTANQFHQAMLAAQQPKKGTKE